MTIDTAITNHYVGIVNDSNVSQKMINKRRGKRLMKKIKGTISSKPKDSKCKM